MRPAIMQPYSMPYCQRGDPTTPMAAKMSDEILCFPIYPALAHDTVRSLTNLIRDISIKGVKDA